MWTYSQTTGELSHSGKQIATGYAGAGAGRNNPSMQDMPRIGPLPRGRYRIGMAYKHDRFGTVCMNLEPFKETEMFGRYAFRIHGDNSTPAPHDGSHGCIILARPIREAINFSDDRILEVVA